MATNWVDEVLSGATSTGSKTLSLATGNVLSVANSSSESLFTVTSDTTNGGYTSILGIEGQEAVLFLGADNSDDAGDVWELHSDTSGNFKIGNRTSGTSAPTRGNTFTNALTIDSSRNITVGVDGTGYDVKFFGDTASNYMLWDTSDDLLQITTTHNDTALRVQSDAARSTADAPDIVIYKNSNSATNDYLGSVKFNSKDAGGGVHTFAEIDTYSIDSTAGGEEGAMFINVLANASETQSLKIQGHADGLSDVEISDGRLQIGVNTVTQGILDIKRKDANEFSYIKMYAADGTASYLFVANDGTLRIHSAAPTANGDGAAV